MRKALITQITNYLLIDMSENHPDKAFEELDKLMAFVGEIDLSELDTRAKIIDPLFIKCLGWTEKDIRREPHINKDYIDYVFSINGKRKFVLEAKKIGQSFIIPNSLRGRYYKIRGTISTDRKIDEAIRQAQRYCIDSGVRYGIVTNGNQYIIFEGFKHGAFWRDGKCAIFRSLKDIKKNFSLFWNTISKESVSTGSLRKNISQEAIPLKFFRPIDYLHAKDSAKARNNLSPLLQPLINYVFEGIIDESQLEVLKKCYVAERQYKNAGLHINRHFDRPPDFAKKYQVKIIRDSKTEAGKFQQLYDKYEEFLRTKAPRGSLVILMGGIGSGKTTFIHYFFNFILKKPETALWFYVDFTKAPPDPTEIQNYIFESIVKGFEHNYRDKLKDDLISVGLTTIKPNLRDIRILFSWLTLKGYTLSLVLDNTDQHSYVSPKYQERALLIAKNLTDTLKPITILTLREESFFKSTMSGVLDAFPPAVFHLSSPAFEKLVRNRINYVLSLLEKDDEQIRAMTGSFIELGTSRETLKIFHEIIKNSLRSTRAKARQILRFIGDVSGGNMRLALRFFTTFLVSGNTDVADMLRIELRHREEGGGESYQLPFHHVIKSIILEHSRLYSSTRSKIMNVFYVNPQHTNSHFLHLRILNYLHTRLSYEPLQGRGYVEIDSIISEAERMSINRGAIKDSLVRMAFFGLVEFENQSKSGYNTATYVRITNTGIYYLEELVHNFVYLDLVWMDTPIADRNLVRELLKHVVELRYLDIDQTLTERFHRTELFLDYLAKMEEKEFKDNTEITDSDLTQKRFMQKIIDSYAEQKEYIQTKRARQKENLIEDYMTDDN